MKRVIVAIHLKNIILAIGAGIVFMLLATFLIVDPSYEDRRIKDKPEKISKNIIKDKENNRQKSEVIKAVRVYMNNTGKIEVLDLEDYVTGVVCAEMPASFELEALKAQAVAARTYALAHIKEAGGNGCKHAKGGDLCDTVHCQAYVNKSDRMKLWPQKQAQKYWDKVVLAVSETSGEVLSYNGELVKEPYYFATSSGKTEDSAEVFSNSVPYLKSVSSLGEERAPKYKSVRTITYLEFVNTINNKYTDIKLSLQDIKENINIIEKSKVGSVKKIKIANITMSGNDFRWLFKLNSSNFSIKLNKDTIDIMCKGNGHGVGMSQWGADAMAKKGENYKDILKHYYNGVDVELVAKVIFSTN